MASLNVGQLYDQFIVESGRNDIDKPTFYNLVNDASDFLDRIGPHHKDEAWLFFNLDAGSNIITFSRHRTIRRVYVADTEDGRSKLEQNSLEWFLDSFGSVPVPESSRARPVYWIGPVLGLGPDQYAQTRAALELLGIVDLDHVLFGPVTPPDPPENVDHLYGILVYPVPDKAYTLEVLLDSYQKEVAADADITYWSAQHPRQLIEAVQRLLEKMNRNTQGFRDIDGPLRQEIHDITVDKFYQDAAGPADEAVMDG